MHYAFTNFRRTHRALTRGLNHFTDLRRVLRGVQPLHHHHFWEDPSHANKVRTRDTDFHQDAYHPRLNERLGLSRRHGTDLEPLG